MTFKKNILQGFANLLYPPICILCKKFIPPTLKKYRKFQLCPTCYNNLKLNAPPFCIKCSRPQKDVLSFLCTTCFQFYQKIHFDRVWGAYLYNELLRELIHLFKYGNKISLKYLFTDLLQSFIQTYSLNLNYFDLILPVPLHKIKYRERGYNQSLLIVNELIKLYPIKSCTSNLYRVRNTKNQALLSQKERWTNIQGAFKIKQPSELNKKNILIIDDLFTTGATVSEIDKILKICGARRVHILTIAIAIHK